MKLRSLSRYIEILTYLWLKWITNHEKANNPYLSMKIRRSSAVRCEKMQRLRYRIISDINIVFDNEIKSLKSGQ